MVTPVNMACESEIVSVAITKILPAKALSTGIKKTAKYQTIAASVRELGVIEPLVVFPIRDNPGHFMLLDGHVRLEVVKELGKESIDCIVSIDDEAFTYNHKVNRLSAIQEHYMIMQAIKNGVREERIARSLKVDVANIRRKRDLLNGVCPEAVELLRDKRVGAGALREIKKVKPMRQMEMAELMIASHNFSVAYVKCLYAATPSDQLVETDKPKDVDGLTADEVVRMEREMESLSQDYRLVEDTHGRNVLNLVVAARYLKKLLDNARAVRFLSREHPEILTEFQKIAESRSLVDAS